MSSSNMYFVSSPVPTLNVYGQNYTGISMLEKLDELKRNPEQYLDISVTDVDHYFNLVALYHQKNIVPMIGFNLKDERAVLPTKRIIDVGFDLTIIDVAKKISDKTTLFETGVALDIPPGFYVEMVPRSSISKTGYMLANNVGIIDPGYISTIKVPLVKVDDSLPNLKLPLRIAQLILKPYVVAHSKQVYDIATTTRGDGGFGSTNA